MTRRVLECNICGEPLAAATDDELLAQMRQHEEAVHPELAFDQDRAREVIVREAYDAADS
jgi:hypothetical protein